MPAGVQQTPIGEILEISSGKCVKPGHYVVQFPISTCFGIVSNGGILVAFIHSAALDFISKTSQPNHHHLLYSAVQFSRPTLPAPRKADIFIRTISSAKSSTALHVELQQNGKSCLSGHFVLANLNSPSDLSAVTGWRLSPPPIHASIESLESDTNPNWVSYLTPFAATSIRRSQTYIRYYIPMKHTCKHTIDQWVTPGWENQSLKDGPVWTNESMHFAIDNCIPPLNDLIGMEGPSLHERILQAGLAQRQARAEGKSDSIIGEGLNDEATFPYVVSTTALTIEIKRLLPQEGAKWLFFRVVTKSLLNNRMDFDIVVMDQFGNLVAVSNHVLQVVHTDMKKAKKSVL